MFFTIYKITNLINNKYYIGMHQTKILDDGYMGSGKLICAAIKKYGKEHFKKEILHILDNEEEMREKEKELVVISECSYNLCEGGKGGFGFLNRTGLNLTGINKRDYKSILKKGNDTKRKNNYHHSQETKNKISKSNKENEGRGIKMSLALKGKPKSPEHKKNLSISLKNRNKEKLKSIITIH